MGGPALHYGPVETDCGVAEGARGQDQLYKLIKPSIDYAKSVLCDSALIGARAIANEPTLRPASYADRQRD